ncbi:hypothetical protein [Marinobacterium lutimaris]|uniref:Lipoprotein n=1 Tax=Marinobacterium lutimaris TaxID=568106 RepID=A0A1H6DTK5_9GAMM|nr:hypothetical protein [Marinobacterium lutimaris]SEG88073.1 hypothetical protein SAMN05444390_10922 [Marinobacterium lutimaris]
MKISRAIAPSLVVTALSLTVTGCITTQGEDTYVNGQCVTCWQNPLSIESSTGANSPTPNTGMTVNGVTQSCRPATSKYDRTWHAHDERWCDNVTLPGASLSPSVTYTETVAAPVDTAYIKAKRFLRFTDPDDNPNGDSPFAAARWDALPGSYYNVVGMYGGPMRQMLWYAEYDLQLEKVSSTRTKVSIRNRVYSRGMDPAEFRKQLMNAIKR